MCAYACVSLGELCWRGRVFLPLVCTKPPHGKRVWDVFFYFPCFSLWKMLILFPLFTSCLSRRTQDVGPSSLLTPCLQQSSSSTDLSVPYVDVSQILLSSLATMACSLHPTSPCGCLAAVLLPVPTQARPCSFLVTVKPTSVLLVMWADNLGLSMTWTTLGVLTTYFSS